MASDYDSALLTAKDQVRFLLGDTDPNRWLLSNEEIQYLVTNADNVNLAAGRAAEAIAGKFARMVDHSIGGDIQVSASQQYKHYMQLAQVYIARGTAEVAEATVTPLTIPYAGGISWADVHARNSDTDRVGPIIRHARTFPDLAYYPRDDHFLV